MLKYVFIVGLTIFFLALGNNCVKTNEDTAIMTGLTTTNMFANRYGLQFLAVGL